MVSEQNSFDEYLERQGDVSNGSIQPEAPGNTPDEQAAAAKRKQQLIDSLGAGTSALLAQHHNTVTQGRADELFRQMTDSDDTPDHPPTK